MVGDNSCLHGVVLWISNPNDGSLLFLNMFFLLFLVVFFVNPFGCGYSGEDVVLLKSYATTNYMYSAGAKHRPSSSVTPNQLKLFCIALIIVLLVSFGIWYGSVLFEWLSTIIW